MSLGRNSVINVAGQTLPSTTAIVAIPLLLTALGAERLGVLTLAWGVVGWFSLFDAGLGRGTTRLIAERLARGDGAGIRALARFAIGSLALLGVVAGLGLAAATPWLVNDLLQVSPTLQGETVNAFYVMALTMPTVLVTAGGRGILEGRGMFGTVNVIRVPATVTLFLGPVAVLPFSHSLVAVTSSLAVTRLAAAACFLIFGFRGLPTGGRRQRNAVRELLTYSGWTGATNLLGALMSFAYLDRFLIGAVISVEASAYYTTPFEVLTKLWLLPMALTAVFFPAFTRAAAIAPERLQPLYARATRWILFFLLPVALLILAGANDLLRLWLDQTYADRSTLVTQLVVIGVLCNALAMVPFTLVQAVGRADLTALRHVVQLPIYIPLSYIMTNRHGIEGTAAVWLTWAVTDFFFLWWLAHRLVPGVSGDGWAKPVTIGTLVAACALGVSHIPSSTAQLDAALVLAGSAVAAGWIGLLNADDRRRATGLLSRKG